ncbi:MAG: ComEA family DNA-binding protein [Pseudomonadales bacterium]|nr:ComEA family DNA-binding protein [Pseudomonadales bacterium]
MNRLVDQLSKIRSAFLCGIVIMFMMAGSLSAAEAQKVNINTASANELSAELLGVGETKSAAIVKNREEMGQFKTPEDITRVKGIGETIFAQNKDRIVVN